MLLALFLIDLAAGLYVSLPLVGRRNAGVKFYRLILIVTGALVICAAGDLNGDAHDDLVYQCGGKVYVAGLSNEQFASTLRAIPFPFTEADKGTSVEIYHGAHGRQPGALH